MNEKSVKPIDINTAGEKELVGIPGVGQATARKIVAARPFASLDDLTKLKGMTAGLAARIRPCFLEIQPPTAARRRKTPLKAPVLAVQVIPTSPPTEESLPEKIKDAIADQSEKIQDFLEETPENLKKVKEFIADQPEKLQDFLEDTPENLKKVKEFIADQPEKIQDLLEDTPENLKKVKAFIAAQPDRLQDFIASQPERFEKVKARTGMSNANLATLLTACLITMVVTILLTIGLLGAINGGLRYPSQNEFSALNRDVESSAARLDMLEKETESIRSRLDALESMSGRMKLIEDENASIRKQLEESSQQVAAVQAQMDSTRSSIEELQKSASFFDRIIAGLRTLLNETTQP